MTPEERRALLQERAKPSRQIRGRTSPDAGIPSAFDSIILKLGLLVVGLSTGIPVHLFKQGHTVQAWTFVAVVALLVCWVVGSIYTSRRRRQRAAEERARQRARKL